MHIRCPHCQSPTEVADQDLSQDLTCASCGSSFSLVSGDATTAHHRPSSRLIGHFELVEQIGVGAFGSVWKARDTELDRMVAVKIPRKEHLDPKEAEQFLREARAAAQLRHPHIVSVHEVGRDGDTIYIVSDLVSGVTLADWLSGQRATPREAARMCAQVAEALHHAHEHGVVHRDLKPGNIMLDAEGKPHLMDFGLAKREGGEVTMTVEGHVLGTPAYMSPEQARGEGHKVDRRSDIYSLGVILFQLLTGELPFRGTPRMLLHQVLHDEPRAPRTLNDQIPRDLETITLVAMAKEPGRRFPTADEMAGDLQRWLRGEPIEARPIGRIQRGWRWCKRNRTVAGLTAAVLTAMAVGTGVSTYFAIRARNFASEVDARAEEAIAERVRSDASYRQARQAVDDSFTAISENKLLNVPGLQPLRKELLESALRYYESFLRDRADDPSLRAELAATHLRAGRIRLAMGELDGAEESFRKALDLYGVLVRENPSEAEYATKLSVCLNKLALLQSETGRDDEAEENLEKAIEIEERLVRENPSVTDHTNDLAINLDNLASLQQRTDRKEKAEENYQKAIEMTENLVRENPSITEYQSNLAISLDNVAGLQSETGQKEKAEANYQKAIGIKERLVRDNPSVTQYGGELATSFQNLANLQKRTYRKEKAEANYQKAIEIDERLVRENPSVTHYASELAIALDNLAILQDETNRKEKAEVNLQKAIEVRERLVRDNPSVTRYASGLAMSLRNLAHLQRYTDREKMAEVNYQKAIEIEERLVRENPSVPEYAKNLSVSMATVLAMQADALAMQRRWAESAAIYSRVCEIGKYQFFPMWQHAALLLAAGDEAAYRAACADLLTRYGDTQDVPERLALVVMCVLGDRAVDDMRSILALAQEVAASAPVNPVYGAAVGVALYRTGQCEAAVAALKKALPAHTLAALAAPKQAGQIQISRLVGEMILAKAHHSMDNREALAEQLPVVRSLIAKLETSPPRLGGSGLAPWAIMLTLELVQRELERIEAEPSTETP